MCDGCDWSFSFDHKAGLPPMFTGHEGRARTAPLAIALAALKVKGITAELAD